MKKEFVIWGKSPGSFGLNETLLLTRIEGEVITSEKEAKKYADILEKKYGCTETRVQCIDYSNTENLFKKAIN